MLCMYGMRRLKIYKIRFHIVCALFNGAIKNIVQIAL
jgi:hypothetical protein